jgi:hypothetical protein
LEPVIHMVMIYRIYCLFPLLWFSCGENNTIGLVKETHHPHKRFYLLFFPPFSFYGLPFQVVSVWSFARNRSCPSSHLC